MKVLGKPGAGRRQQEDEGRQGRRDGRWARARRSGMARGGAAVLGAASLLALTAACARTQAPAARRSAVVARPEQAKASAGARPVGVRVRDAASLRRALAAAKAGTRILLAPGDYGGGFMFSDLHGAAGKPIVVEAENPADPPRFSGGANCLHLAEVSYLELRNLALTGATDNGINIDDGGTFETPSHHVLLSGLRVSRVGPSGNRDGIKLSGLDDFRLEQCVVEEWGDGGSGVDMVGCHRGLIEGCTFRRGGASAVQAKGGTSEVTVRRCRFEDAGERAVNLGGSTGLAFFRPKPQGYEGRNLTVEGCTFAGGQAPLAFVGVDGATVRYNTLYHPGRWALRILQETRAPGFVPSRRGVFENNIVVFRSDSWAEGGVNIGPGTAPETFRFARNVWYCEDRPDRSQPRLPTPETGAIVGRDPRLRDPARGDFRLAEGSPAEGRGATALPRPTRAPGTTDRPR